MDFEHQTIGIERGGQRYCTVLYCTVLFCTYSTVHVRRVSLAGSLSPLLSSPPLPSLSPSLCPFPWPSRALTLFHMSDEALLCLCFRDRLTPARGRWYMLAGNRSRQASGQAQQDCRRLCSDPGMLDTAPAHPWAVVLRGGYVDAARGGVASCSRPVENVGSRTIVTWREGGGGLRSPGVATYCGHMTMTDVAGDRAVL